MMGTGHVSHLRLERLVQPEAYRCLSCNACRSACTMHAATNRLQPLKLVRMATIGLREHVLRAPELWYCLQCNQCSQACPMQLEPATLIARLRDEAVRHGAVEPARHAELDGLRAGLQRARWHLIRCCAEGRDADATAEDYARWSSTPVEVDEGPLEIEDGADARRAIQECLGFSADLSACMTCGACTSVCPVTWERTVYDPVALFRMVNLGRVDDVLRSPALWLCLGCGRCTRACTQGVAGHLVIRSLQRIALARGVVPADMPERVWNVHRALFPWFLAEVDAVLGRRPDR